MDDPNPSPFIGIFGCEIGSKYSYPGFYFLLPGNILEIYNKSIV